MTTERTSASLVLTERVKAGPDRVFDFLVDPEQMLRWMGTEADIDARPGGRFWLNVTGTDIASGSYVEVDRPNRVVFTWGWEGSDEVPPASSTVTITLTADGDETIVELRHDGLPDGQIETHGEGWNYFVDRLAAVAEGRDPGPSRYAKTEFELLLTGGHHNSLGRTVEVVDAVLANRSRLDELYRCYFSDDEVVRLRVSSAMKRVTTEHPDWTMAYIDGLQSEVAAIDQASTQWTLALLFDLMADLLSPRQRARAIEIMQDNLANHGDWIVLNNSMKVLGAWSMHDPALADWLGPHAERLAKDERKSVASNARKLLDLLAG